LDDLDRAAPTPARLPHGWGPDRLPRPRVGASASLPPRDAQHQDVAPVAQLVGLGLRQDAGAEQGVDLVEERLHLAGSGGTSSSAIDLGGSADPTGGLRWEIGAPALCRKG